MTSMARIVSLAILTTLIVFLGLTFYQIIAPFLLPLFLAGVTAVWCQPLYGYFLKKFRQRDRWAAAATTATVFLALFIPLVVGVFSAAMQLLEFTQTRLNAKSLTAAVQKLQKSDVTEEELKAKVRGIGENVLNYIQPLPADDASDEERAKAKADREQLLAELEEKFSTASEDAGVHLQELAMKSLGLAASGGWGLTSRTFGILGAAVGGLIQLTMFLIALYYFLCDGSALLTSTEALIPVQVDYQRQLIHEFNRVVQAVVSATMLSSIAQGAATAIALFVVGVPSIFLMFVLATFASLIPIAGTWMVWGPCAAWLAYQGSWGAAIFLTVIGVAVIGTMDNIIKAYVLQNDTSLHPLLAFVSVFGGMQVMGLWGIFVGPIVACCLHALVKIFNTELGELSKAKFAKTQTSAENLPSQTTDQRSTPAPLERSTDSIPAAST